MRYGNWWCPLENLRVSPCYESDSWDCGNKVLTRWIDIDIRTNSKLTKIKLHRIQSGYLDLSVVPCREATKHQISTLSSKCCMILSNSCTGIWMAFPDIKAFSGVMKGTSCNISMENLTHVKDASPVGSVTECYYLVCKCVTMDDSILYPRKQGRLWSWRILQRVRDADLTTKEICPLGDLDINGETFIDYDLHWLHAIPLCDKSLWIKGEKTEIKGEKRFVCGESIPVTYRGLVELELFDSTKTRRVP